jgi:hypothetical protein
MQTVSWEITDTAWTKALKKRGSIYFYRRDVFFKFPFLCLYHSWLSMKARLLNSSIIHVIGDSHIKPFIFRDPFMLHHISQATAYNLNKDNSESQSKKYLNSFLAKIDKKRDVVLLVFGEIDARVHIYYQYKIRDEKVSIEELVEATADRYGEAIRRLKSDGFAVCVHGIPPAARRNFASDLPFVGSPEQRSHIFKAFNARLRDFCERNGVTYIDVQSVSADEEGFFKKEYLADEVHLNSNIVPFARAKIIEAFKDSRRFL